MISYQAFKVADVLVEGGETAHALRWSIATKGIPDKDIAAFLREGLAELCRLDFVVWTYEPQYGDSASVIPPSYDEATFRHYWDLCFKDFAPQVKIPDADNPTLSFDPTEALRAELSNPAYDYYHETFRRAPDDGLRDGS